MTANDSKSYLAYLNKLVHQYTNNYLHSINKNLLMLIILLWPKILRPNLKLLSLKLMMESGYTENWSRDIFIIDFVLKTNSWTYKIKDFNGEKVKGRFYEKDLFLSKL